MTQPGSPAGGIGHPVAAIAATARIAALRADTDRALLVLDASSAPAPALALGERVAARVLERLPNQRLLVQVKGALLTLQGPAAQRDAPPGAPRTPGGAAALGWAQADGGDTLALEVSALSPRLSFVLAASTGAAPAATSAAATLSDSAQYIAGLMGAVSRASNPPALPGRGGANVLMPDPQANLDQRARSLAQAVNQSGLFYESHLQAWADGRLPMDGLRTEPQARAAQALHDATPAAREEVRAELGGLLQRQLDALEGKALAFGGFAWPGQRIEWQLQRDVDEEPADQHDADGAEHPPSWSTRLDLDLPRLGALGAQLRVVGSEVTLAMTLANGATAALIETHRARLAAALQAAGLTLTALTVRHEKAGEP